MEVKAINKYAGFLKRLVAFIIDRFVLWVLLGILFFRNIDLDMWEIGNLFSIKTLVIEFILLLYFVYFESMHSWQATIGKKLMGLRVVTENYQRLSPKESVVRFLVKYLSSAVLGLGFLSVIWNAKKQGWHDRIAGTLVIEES